MKPSTLILITSAFPADTITEPTFIMPELRAMAGKFKKVVVMPMQNLPDLAQIDLSDMENVTVSMELANDRLWRHKWMRGVLMAHPLALRALLSGKFDEVTYALSALTVRRTIKRLGLNPGETLLYSYWFESQAPGAALSPITTIIRAHGHDVWTERGHRLRAMALDRSAALFAVSDSGAEHIRECYPESATKVTVSRLGCLKLFPDRLSSYHKAREHRLTFITCARCSPEKRTPLIYQFVKAVAVARPATEVKWIYVGDGPEMENLKETIESDTRLSNFTPDLRGSLQNSEVQKIYANEAIDWSILLSTTEGLPISICESLSYGVPVIATDVGGISEIVNDSCGLLLPPDPEKEEFVRGIAPYLDSDYRMEQLRKGALEKWSAEADATRLSEEFAQRISQIEPRGGGNNIC